MNLTGAFLDLISVSLDRMVNQDLRDDGQHFVCYQIRGNYKTIQSLKACLKEGICCKAQTIGYLSLFFFFFLEGQDWT